MVDKYEVPVKHQLTIENREKMDITGVLNVDSFDDEEIILETQQGLLAIRGEELHIKNLNLEQGELNVEGLIMELAYSEERSIKHGGRGLLGRLFR
ncbi:MAG: sporulation protein YabP [Firmicutes bacterium]|nr:sporulation protein YabP [Bacillota bacterium]